MSKEKGHLVHLICTQSTVLPLNIYIYWRLAYEIHNFLLAGKATFCLSLEQTSVNR